MVNIPGEIEVIPVEQLTPFARNSRTHSEEQVAQIAASIREFGFTNPVLINAEGGIIAGHGRVMGAKAAGLKSVPCIRLAHLTPEQERAYVIADNQLALNAGWDNDLLALELRELNGAGFSLDLLGFDTDALDALLNGEQSDGGAEGLTDPDEAPELQESVVSRVGQVWILGRHRVMCGDSTDQAAVANLMSGQRAALVFTDPPYGVEYQSNSRSKTRKFEVLKNDDVFLNIAPMVELFSDGWVFFWTSWKVQTKWIELFSSFGYPSNVVIWHKPGGGIGDLRRTFASDYEVALVWHRGAELCGKRVGSVWTINKDGATTYVHPMQKPVALSEEAIDKTTAAGAVVLDLFGGSGSTLIGCEKTGRLARIMELDPRYCDVIIRRWQEFTGKEAILEATGETYAEVAAAHA